MASALKPPKNAIVSRWDVLLSNFTPYTRDLRHVTAVVPRLWKKQRFSFYEPKYKDVKPKDRIKWWNIVPGDEVRLRGDPEGMVRQVSSVNRFTNRVFLRTEKDHADNAGPPRGKNVHYSKCQLLVGRFRFPPAEGSTEPQTLPVFASRLGTSAPFWHPLARRFQWERFAIATQPRLPDYSPGSETRIPIPWPKAIKPAPVAPSPYDTTADAVNEITYRPPVLPQSIDDAASVSDAVPSEQEYIRSLAKRSAFDPAAPVEIYVHRELTNPHSRAKKQERWKIFQMQTKSLLQEMIQEEYKNLMGRTHRDARAEAIWKWRNKLAEDRKAEMKRRWVNRGAETRLMQRRARKAKKAERMRNKLRNLVLPIQPNQILPGQARPE
ncbi:hypothetical protein PsYK624_007710 [Phanerochaete sordida]|uniref:KOW domain-containing protein n=1 Tax=Phanerochaete sordida TaxID=48140 RepID=A0A9P3FYK0_9APHY|nr:hypothetical protein PsYK624_007710 [Phanerochaete sordida]